MAEGAFRIKEIGRIDGREGEYFVWTADSTIPAVDTVINGVEGGLRACPQGVWDIGGVQATVKTRYTGDVTPSEQILGPQQDNQSFRGVWDDRYNFENYAVETMRRFEDMCRRGNLVEISFQEQSFQGVITKWKFSYKKRSEIGYMFEFSVHDRTDNVERNITPKQEASSQEAFDGLSLEEEALNDDQSLKPAAALDEVVSRDVEESVENLNKDMTQAGDTISQRELALDTANQGLSPYKRLATHFRNVQTSAAAVVDQFDAVRSDTTMLYRTALNVLDFEVWYRSTVYRAHLIMGNAHAAGLAMDRRDEPDAKRIYRPKEKESLHDISRRFYGTPWAWELIYERNGLTDYELTGDEELIIPEGVQG